MPGALLVVLVGVTIAIIQYPSVLRTLRLGPSVPQLVWPSWEEWKKGAASFDLLCIMMSVLLWQAHEVNASVPSLEGSGHVGGDVWGTSPSRSK